MSDWIKIDPANFIKAKHESIDGVRVEIFLSPFDIPEAVRGFYIPNEQRFVIEFQYIGSKETLETEVQEDGVTILVGRNSKRLYQIEIELDKKTLRESDPSIKLKLFLPTVGRALGRLATKPEVAHRAGNYKVAKEILTKSAPELSRTETRAAL